MTYSLHRLMLLLFVPEKKGLTCLNTISASLANCAEKTYSGACVKDRVHV